MSLYHLKKLLIKKLSLNFNESLLVIDIIHPRHQSDDLVACGDGGTTPKTMRYKN